MKRICILGAGMAGLSCAWLLKQRGIDAVVLEREEYAGGLARSFHWHGFDCDIAAHRLFSRDEQSLNALLALVPMSKNIRRSQIYFNGRWMRDPIDIGQLMLTASPLISADIVRTYFTRPSRLPQDSFRNYVVARYGARLYDYFFRPYTEKLFGIPGHDISAMWAREKVRLANPLDRFKPNTKTKFRYFYYPMRGGYGAIPSKLEADLGNQIRLNCQVTGFQRRDNRITHVELLCGGERSSLVVDSVISTLPLTITVRMLGGDLDMSFQKIDAVYLLLDKPLASPNHWIYFMDDKISINRLVEFKNMSPIGKPEQRTVVCAEVTRRCVNPIEQVINDLVTVKFIRRTDVLDQLVVSEDHAYPVYDKRHEAMVVSARRVIDPIENLQLVGRSAEFKHREVDDNFAAALEVVQQLLSKEVVRRQYL